MLCVGQDVLGCADFQLIATQEPVLDPEQNGFCPGSVNIDLRVEHVAAEAVFVVDRQLSYAKRAVRLLTAGQVTLDRLDRLAGQFQAIS